MRRYTQTLVLLLMLPVWPAHADKLPDLAEIETQKAVIGEIVIERDNVFDLSDPEENNWLFQLANRLHVVTREKTIRKQLLIGNGDEFSKRLSDESERILRKNLYLHDADIRPIRLENGVVDLEVRTRDVWTLAPEISLARSGGENRSSVGLEESNLFGRGQLLRIVRDVDVDRASNIFEFKDKHLGRSRVSAFLNYANSSDGDSHLVSAVRPFYALDSRWSAGGWSSGSDREEALYSLGHRAAEYRHKRDYASLFGGWSKGLRNGRVHRWTFGFVHDDNRFSTVPTPTLPAVIPANRKLIYPFIGLEMVEDNFETSRNRNQIGRTEDFLMGTRLAMSFGWSDTSFGANRNALVYSASASHGFGALKDDALLLAARASGRIESGHTKNSRTTLSVRYYHTQSEKHLFYASVDATAGNAPDLDNLVRLGGDTGLRGYPLRYQNGDSKLLLTFEQRFFTDWYPWRLARVGAAIFADAGRVWGENPLDEPDQGWLTDVGIGLRFALTRSASRKVIHLDLAFPLGGDPTIDDVQILLEARRGF